MCCVVHVYVDVLYYGRHKGGERWWVVGIDEMEEIYPPSRHVAGQSAIPSSTSFVLYMSRGVCVSWRVSVLQEAWGRAREAYQGDGRRGSVAVIGWWMMVGRGTSTTTWPTTAARSLRRLSHSLALTAARRRLLPSPSPIPRLDSICPDLT
jgi:hypothetical protein